MDPRVKPALTTTFLVACKIPGVKISLVEIKKQVSPFSEGGVIGAPVTNSKFLWHFFILLDNFLPL